MKTFKTYITERSLHQFSPDPQWPIWPDWWGNQPKYPRPIYPLDRPAPIDPYIPYPANSYETGSNPEIRDLIRYIQEGGWKPGDAPPPAPPGMGLAQWLELFFGIILPLFINQSAGDPTGDASVIPSMIPPDFPVANKPISTGEPDYPIPGAYGQPDYSVFQGHNWFQ